MGDLGCGSKRHGSTGAQAAGAVRRRGARRLALPLLLSVGMGGLAGCEGRGEGQIDGRLFLRHCPVQDPLAPDAAGLPSPLPEFSLDPQYFLVDVMFAQKPSWFPDPRAVDSMFIRLQRTSHKPDRTDVFTLSVHDIDGILAVQEQALARGEPGVPILPPMVSTGAAPLPPDPAQSVRADIALNGSCQFSTAEPLLRGHIRFSSLGRNIGEEIAGELKVSVEDGRAIREQGSPPPSPDAAGELSGWFRFNISRGQRGYIW